MKRGLLVMAVLFAAASLRAETFYISNALGMPIREIQEFRVDEFPFVLLVIEGQNTIVKVLLKNQNEYKKWELEYSDSYLVAESLYMDGQLREVRRYEVGQLMEELYYEGESLEEKRTYIYEGDELREVVAVDQEGITLYRDVYERSAAGRLRRVQRAGEEKAVSSEFTYSRGELVQEWHGKDEEGLLFRYHDGEKLAEESWEGLKLLLAEEVRMHEGRKEIVAADNTLGIVTTQYFDEEDRVEIERTVSEDDLIEHVRFEYEDEEENVSQKTRITRNAKEEWEYEYDKSGEILRETLVRNTWIVKVIEHTGKNTFYEEIYRDGEPSLRVYFEDGKKVDEVFLGAPVRSE
jgi:hypothetical protein